MKPLYVLDACALIAVIAEEKGQDVVKDLLQKGIDREIDIVMHKVNLIEVYYYLYRTRGEQAAIELLADAEKMAIKIDAEVTDDILMAAGRLKVVYKTSLGDSIGLAESIVQGGCFVTADRHELGTVVEKENLNVLWFRKREIK